MTAAFIDYDLILTDFKNAVVTANLGFQSVYLDAGDIDYRNDQMPMLDLRWKKIEPEANTNATYYSIGIIEAEITAFDFTSRREAAKLRNDLTNALQRFVKDNPRFSSPVETVIIGQAVFATGESKAQGAFVAGAILEFHPTIFTE
jgi:hypothetical protein